jgi:succinate dehydrogenase/fumarate reductase-like Fe-S protein
MRVDFFSNKGILMHNRLNVRMFRFNADTDYLRYYKDYDITTSSNKVYRLIDLLKDIKKSDKLVNFSTDKNSYIVVNSQIVKLDTLVSEVTAKFGSSLQLEPLSTKRAKNDLSINNSDFKEKLSIFDFITDVNDRMRYQNYEHLYYASDILKYNDDFVGDSAFALAYELIRKYPEREVEILEKIADENGIWLYTADGNLFNECEAKELDQKVKFLKQRILSKLSTCLVKKINKDITDSFELPSNFKKVLNKDCPIVKEIKNIWEEVRS